MYQWRRVVTRAVNGTGVRQQDRRSGASSNPVTLADIDGVNERVRRRRRGSRSPAVSRAGAASAAVARGMGPALPAPAATLSAPGRDSLHQQLSRTQSLPVQVRQRRARPLPAALALSLGSSLPVAATSGASLPLPPPPVPVRLSPREPSSKYSLSLTSQL